MQFMAYMLQCDAGIVLDCPCTIGFLHEPHEEEPERTVPQRCLHSTFSYTECLAPVAQHALYSAGLAVDRTLVRQAKQHAAHQGSHRIASPSPYFEMCPFQQHFGGSLRHFPTKRAQERTKGRGVAQPLKHSH
mmetsp:Transcript_61677/g.133607  ORF Transcript_61677/g.133607 Transcript_61677/m.133607 type:complete len:133 (+) Transcript_61677:1629-2027(+)